MSYKIMILSATARALLPKIDLYVDDAGLIVRNRTNIYM